MTLMGLSFMTNAPKPKWLEVPIPSIVNVATVKVVYSIGVSRVSAYGNISGLQKYV